MTDTTADGDTDMPASYQDIYAGDLNRTVEQIARIDWSGTNKAQKEWAKGIPGQTSAVSTFSNPPALKERGPKTKLLSFYKEGIEEHTRKLEKRRSHDTAPGPLVKYALADENYPPRGQAYGWYQEVIHYVPLSGMLVAKQIARLCGDDSRATVPYRSLADATSRKDSLGRRRAFTERGVQALVESGWLTVETIGSKRGAKTTFYLQVGDHSMEARRNAANSHSGYDLGD